MVAANGVSRTVVREAVAALRADGLVVVRQGVGAFVAANVRRPFRIDVEGLRSLRQALDVMELRMGIEVEAAGLAAERGTAAQIRKIAHAYEAVDLAIDRGETAIDEDFAFHVSIADATGNPQFSRFSGISRPFHHSPQDRSRELAEHAEQPRLSENFPGGARRHPRRHPRRSADAGARIHAAASGQ